MKKILFIGLCILGTALNASAQLKIHSNGKMSFQNPDTVALSSVSLNCKGDSSYYMTYKGSRNGISCTTNNTGNEELVTAGYFESSNMENAIGVEGFATTSSHSFLEFNSIGVLGHADNSGYTYSYGVAGCFSADFGAAIYGTTSSSVGELSGVTAGKYAGYFDGTTKVVGNFYTTGSIYSPVLLGNSSTSTGLQSVMPLTTDRGDVTGMLSRLNAQTYYQPAQEETEATPSENGRQAVADERDGSKAANKPEPDIIGEQISTKMHYGLSADELEEVFPDLVYTDKNGEKSINYVEMVPLLVQCINELNARLSALDGNGVGADLQSPMPARSVGADPVSARSQTTSIGGTSSKTKAVLYQNTPNPFTAQTEIRFSLPDNALQAYIYIFDMTGKMQKQIPVDPNQKSVTISGYELQAGIYLYSLVVGGQEIDTKRMIITK